MFEFLISEGELATLTPGLLLAFGFAIGLQHGTEGDHVAAVTTLVGRNRKLRKASLLGVFWGFGHTLTLFLAGLAILLLAVSIPAKLALSLEFGVGIMLIVLGLAAIRNVRRNRFLDYFFGMFTGRHIHPHAHGDKIHVHPHRHARSSSSAHEDGADDHGEEAHSHSHKSIIIGMIHGLAGSGALMLVVLSTVDSIAAGLAYIVIFGIGSVVGMVAISTVIGVPFVYTAKRLERMNGYIRVAAAAVSIGFGASIMYGIGILEELFIVV